MDYLRSAYRSRMRLWAGSPWETEVVWFRAPKGALAYPGVTRFGSSVWVETTRGADTLGELLEGVRPWSNGQQPAPYLGTAHCGPESAFREGGVIGRDASLPLLPNGAALCCPLAVGGAGPGPMLGGAARFNGIDQGAAGGAQLGGAAWFGSSWQAAGGAQLGGAARFNGIDQGAAGGAQLGGAARFGSSWQAAGGTQVSGAARFGSSWQAAGGAQLGGAARFGNWSNGFAFAGNAQLGGAARFNGVDQGAAGGTQVSGAAGFAWASSGGSGGPAFGSGGPLVGGAGAFETSELPFGVIEVGGSADFGGAGAGAGAGGMTVGGEGGISSSNILTPPP